MSNKLSLLAGTLFMFAVFYGAMTVAMNYIDQYVCYNVSIDKYSELNCSEVLGSQVVER